MHVCSNQRISGPPSIRICPLKLTTNADEIMEIWKILDNSIILLSEYGSTLCIVGMAQQSLMVACANIWQACAPELTLTLSSNVA